MPKPDVTTEDVTGEAASLGELTQELADLRDLFRRRLFNDQVQQRAYDELARRLVAAEAAAEARPLMALLRQVVLVLDRTTAPGEPADLLQSVREELLEILARQGAQPLGSTVGQRFDPTLHHAVAVLDVDEQSRDQLVVAERRTGYLLDGRVLRPAEVEVGRAQRPAGEADR